MKPIIKTLLLLFALVSGLATSGMANSGEKILVFAAASLADALTESGNTFTQSQGITVNFSFSSSSTLARQIEAGAPAALAALASEDWVDYLEDRNLLATDTRISTIGNRLVLIAPMGTVMPGPDPLTTAGIRAALGQEGRLALGDPAHVPAGIYARQALENLGLWQAVAPRLAPAGNVRAALALVARGEAPLGIVYATDARMNDSVQILATLPADTHTPISYPFAIIRDNDNPASRAFLAFLTSPKGRAIFYRFGFTGG